MTEYRYGILRFCWDDRKAAVNKRKHGISFEEAVTVFVDPVAAVYDDPDHSDDEDRFLLVDHALTGRLLLVEHAERTDRIRIISARKPTARERRDYKNHA